MEALFEMMAGLVEAASHPDSPTHEIGDMAQFVVAAANRADRATLNRLATELSAVVDIESPHAPVTFILSGALVENGADADLVADVVLHPLPRALEVAAEFVDTLARTHGEITEEVWAASANERPNEWAILDLIWRPCVAVLGGSKPARAQMRPHWKTSARLGELHAAGHWVTTMLRVLDNEPLLVVHPESGRAFECTMSGIASNFELQTLLMGALIGDPADGWLLGDVPSPATLAAVRGDGPQVCEEPVAGQWNMYTAAALDAEGEIPASEDLGSAEHWVWGEGVPDDIPARNGRRVVLLGPPSYARSYASHRSFATLRPTLTVDRCLEAREAIEALRGH